MASEIGKAASSILGFRKLRECKARTAVLVDDSIRRRKSEPRVIKSTDSTKTCTRHPVGDCGYDVDLSDLLFTAERDFLVKNNGDKVSRLDLMGKTIVVYIFPLYDFFLRPGGSGVRDTVDMIQAYHELLGLGGNEYEFVLVPVYLVNLTIFKGTSESTEALFDRLFSTIPFPAVPFSDIASCGDRVVTTFSVDYPFLMYYGARPRALPYWVIIDPNGKVVATRFWSFHLFKIFGGAELHPLSMDRLIHLDNSWDGLKYRKLHISKWDQLLASPTRDYLLSTSGNRVSISSLKGKVVGLYFCENVPKPPSMELVKKVYAEAKSRGLKFEIVQINFHFHFFNAVYARTADTSKQQRYENVDWLTLPFGDPSCRKLQRIFKCENDDDHAWTGDCLVIVDARNQEADIVFEFEFSGVEIFKHYGVEGYPFTRKYLVGKELEMQKLELNLPLIFPQGRCLFCRPSSNGFDLVGDSQHSLSGKRVLLLFAQTTRLLSCEFVSMLKTKYLEQLQDAAQGNKFEVVYVSADCPMPDYIKATRDMPWLVHRQAEYLRGSYGIQILKIFMGIGAAAFNMDGELIAKESWLESIWGTNEHHKDEFPFVSPDLKGRASMEVECMCKLDRYYNSDDEVSDSDDEV